MLPSLMVDEAVFWRSAKESFAARFLATLNSILCRGLCRLQPLK
jgi:hypothetical protein